MDNEQINIMMEEIESNISEINSTNRTVKKKKKQIEEEENENIKKISERMNNILSNNYQTITDSTNSTSDNELDKMFRKNIIINERIIVVNIMLKLYPNLEKDRKFILDKVLCIAEPKVELYVLEKIKVGETICYKDTQGYIIDTNINVIGISINIGGKEKYFIVNDVKKITSSFNTGIEMVKKLDEYFYNKCKHQNKNK
jgi:hypothetical protein